MSDREELAGLIDDSICNCCVDVDELAKTILESEWFKRWSRMQYQAGLRQGTPNPNVATSG